MLNDKAISQAKPKEKLYRLSDNIGNNLSIEIAPTGSKRWRFRYVFNGSAKMISLGTYPEVSLIEAREKAMETKKQVEHGIDPSAEKKTAKKSNLFKNVAVEWFEIYKTKVSENQSKAAFARLNQDVFPYIGNKPIKDIDPPTVLSILKKIEGRGAIATSKKVKSHISQIFKYAIACGLVFIDPSRDLSPALMSHTTKHFAAITNPKEVAELMKRIKSYDKIIIRSALLLGVLTFVRPNELRHAEWHEFDLEEKMWRISAEKMKRKRPHIVPLSRQAIDIIEELRKFTGGGRYLFPSMLTDKKPINRYSINLALRYLGYTKDEMTGHGFRAMASSLLAEQGWSVDAIELQLAHVEKNKVRAAYHISEHLEERTRMMQAWADYLDHLQEQYH